MSSSSCRFNAFMVKETSWVEEPTFSLVKKSASGIENVPSSGQVIPEKSLTSISLFCVKIVQPFGFAPSILLIVLEIIHEVPL